ncbi:VWA domain-containing protein [Pseudomaricurvus alkylphenolicus]|uniref:PilC/PilY family type IV pilus protein n=1 Tax=Pseudomaricurvus alkylphenolicus TaxID=1306991 RepID=UPI0014210CEB|nr:PilC/PilY family type IV pilus protein [Pseudomaricurvus alkylphenolicus]NIB40249.1 VWA domain-containing protein [Pseudomaricurvus alkylphenolicus]
MGRKTLRDTLRWMGAGFIYTSLGLTPAYADDTEIYFGGNFIGSGVETRPNILFVLDTSGSMSYGLDPDNPSYGTNERLDALKQAMTSVLSSVSNVNIGIMRFTNPGGPVLHPVTYVDEISGSTTQTVTSQVDSSQSDATETVVGGTVNLTGDTLELVEAGTAGAVATITESSTYSEDMRTEMASGTYQGETWISSCPTLIERTYNCDSSGTVYDGYLGVRFRNVDVPKGATIDSASLSFVIEDQQGNNSREDSRDLSVRIQAEAEDSGSFANSYYSVSSRLANLSASTVDWDIGTNPSRGSRITSNDISPIMQELVDHANWVDGSSTATFILSEPGAGSQGRREIYGSGDSSGYPQLHVSYTLAGSLEAQAVGLRFADVAVPSQATITNAYIEFTAASTNSDSATYTIAAEDTGNADEFDETSKKVRTRTKTSNQVTWSNVESWDSGETYNSPEVTTIVQELVNRGDWCGGNAMAFILEGSATGRRIAHSYDGAPSAAPRLIVEYDATSVPDAGGCTNYQRSYQIAAETDDAEQSGATGNSDTSNTELNLASNRRHVGVRFSGLSVPQGADITSAYIEFEAANSDSGATTITIGAQDDDNAGAFDGSSSDLSNRSLTATSSWSPEDWSAGSTYRTSDISAQLEAVVGRSGWAIGNSVAFILEHSSGGSRDALSYDDQRSAAPRLVFTYSTTDFTEGLLTIRDDLQSIIDNEIIASGSTPIVETYHEAALYMRGDSVLYGKDRSTSVTRRGYEYSIDTRVSTSDSWEGGTLHRPSGCTDSNWQSDTCKEEYISGSATYISPMEYSCQENHIVFLTDGEPTDGNDSVDALETLTGTSCATTQRVCEADPDGGDPICTTNDLSAEYQCAFELSEYLATEDQDDGVGSLAGDQTITTHTIALIDGASAWLEEIATQGGGGYYPISGSSVDQVATNLTEAFQTIIGSVLDVDTSFVAPAVAINQFNRLTHRDEIYYAMFKPLETPRWPGNLKKYKLSGQNVDIVDANNALAVDLSTGGFKTTSKSLWSEEVDGNTVTLGGAANKVPDPDERKIYLHHSTSSSTLLTADDNLVLSTNDEITKSMLGIPSASDAERIELINWIRGVDVEDEDGDGDRTDLRYVMNDPLHSRPIVVTYDADPNGDGDGADAEYYLFYGTNGGYLHVVDGSTGTEKMAILQDDLLTNFSTLYNNLPGTERPYGLDGASTIWRKDVDGDGKIEAGDGDHVYLYIGMRRGGRSYYAYDLTDIDAPKLLWKVAGGSGDFSEMGQTWSKPLLTQITYKSGGDAVTKPVLVIGGGYDESQDDANVRSMDSMGRAVYIVDAETGDLLWKAGKDFTGNAEDVDEMLYSVPADIAGADTNNDGVLDVIFYGDTGGQVFRVDFDSSGTKSLAQFATVQRIADVAIDSSAADARRFYHGADIALVREGTEKYLIVLLGSGYRAHPLDKDIDDRFYAIKQLLDGEATHVNLDEDDLYDATDNLIQDGNDSEQTEAQALLDQAKGWYIKMENDGEKVLSRPLVVEGTVVFTTYEPLASNVGCEPVPGRSREYLVNILDATSTIDRDDIEGLSRDDRSDILNVMGIVDDIVIVMTGEGIQGFQGTQHSDLDLGLDRAVRTYWYQED